ncbi:MAG: phosphoglycolate phosphatase [Ruegeria sp.]
MSAVVIFDLDGTLVDSVADLATAVNRMLKEQGVDPLPAKTVQRFVGNGLPKLVERVMRHCDLPSARHAELTQNTLQHYSAAPISASTVYPGIPEALQQLRDSGCALGVCTNKPEAPARHVLDAFDLSPFFGHVIGGDSLSVRKPDPALLTACVSGLSQAGPTIFVGDSEVDAETARRAKVPFLLFSQGYRKSPVAEIPHRFSYDDSAEIPALVQQIVQAETRPA